MRTKLLLLMAFALMGWSNVWAESYTTGPNADGNGNSFAFESTDGTTATITWVYIGENSTAVTIPTKVWSGSEPYGEFTITAVGTGSNAINNSASSITSLTIAEGVTTINTSAFYGWSGLSSIWFPQSLTNIGSYAFQNCDALTSVTFQTTTPPTIGASAFATSAEPWYHANCIVKVPDGATAKYNSSDVYWYLPSIYAAHHIHELTYPSITTAGWGTYYNDYGYIMPKDVEGYIINWTYNGKANLVKVYDPGDKVCPNIALLWKSTSDLAEETWYTVEALASGDDSPAVWPVDGESKSYTNLLYGYQTAQPITAPWSSDNGFYYYKLANDSKHGLGWYWGDNNDPHDGGAFTSGAHKAFMAIAKTSAGARSFISMFDDSETTAIADVRGKKEDVRSDYFNLKGQRVVNPTKGLYIVNGKKVIIK